MSDEGVQLLVVTINFKLDFNTHIFIICIKKKKKKKKAAHQLNALNRIDTHLNRLAELTIYHSFIM